MGCPSIADDDRQGLTMAASRLRWHQPIVVGALLAALLLTSACSTTESPEASPSVSEAPTESATPSETPETVTIPECDVMNPRAMAMYQALQTEYPNSAINDPGEPSQSFFDIFIGPAGKAALEQVTETRACEYYLSIGTGTAAQQFVSELPADAADEFMESLRASDYVESSILDYPTFKHQVPWDIVGMLHSVQISHVFVGPLWVTQITTGWDYTWSGVQSVLDANPHLSTLPEPPEGCSEETAESAMERWGDQVPAPFDSSGPDVGWAFEWANTRNFDACTMLSWITLSVEGATGSSPVQIMLFHYGEYIGTATEKAYGFEPTILEMGPNEVMVAYKWVKDGESNAEGSGRSVSVFTLDPDTGDVTREGDLPPY